MRTAKLDEIVQRKGPALKSAVELLAKRQNAAALEAPQRQGRLSGQPSPE